MKKVFVLALMFLLVGCKDERPYRTPIKPQSAPPAVETLRRNVSADVQCAGEMPTELQERFQDFRIAESSDFVASLRQVNSELKNPLNCNVFTADFNQDDKLDYALLLVNKVNGVFRFEMLINRGDGKFGTAAVRSFKPPLDSKDGVIYTAMFLKPAGEVGPASRDNFPLKSGTEERKVFESKPAIELWRALDTDVDGLPKNLEVSTLAYCSDLFYFDGEGRLKQLTVCD